MIKNDFSYTLYFLFCSHLSNRRVVEVCNISIHHNVDVNVNFWSLPLFWFMVSQVGIMWCLTFPFSQLRSGLGNTNWGLNYHKLPGYLHTHVKKKKIVFHQNQDLTKLKQILILSVYHFFFLGSINVYATWKKKKTRKNNVLCQKTYDEAFKIFILIIQVSHWITFQSFASYEGFAPLEPIGVKTTLIWQSITTSSLHLSYGCAAFSFIWLDSCWPLSAPVEQCLYLIS